MSLHSLNNAIAKWERIVAGTGVDVGKLNCGLCNEYLSCQHCPVNQNTGKKHCQGTPYQAWARHHTSHHFAQPGAALTIKCPTCQELAERELEYLKSLRKQYD